MRRRVTTVVGVIGSFLMAGGVLAAAPDAGSTLRNVPPAPEMPASPGSPLPPQPEEPVTAPGGADFRVTVTRFIIRGASAIPPQTLSELVRDGEGQSLTLAQLESYARRITRYYRDEGYMLARAYLPEQEIVDGTIEIAVLEGRVGQAILNNTSRIDESRLSPYLEPLAAGSLIKTGPLERQLLLLGDVAGVEVGSLLRPGAETGTSDLEVTVEDAARFSGSVDLSNYGSEATGEARLGATLNVANLAGRGDRASVRLLSGGTGLLLGRLAWEAPLDAAGWRAGAAFTRMRYDVGGQFESLEADGEATAYSLWTSYALVRSSNFNLVTHLGADRKHLRDVIGVTDTIVEKRVDSGVFLIGGNSRDMLGGGGINEFALTVGVGDLRLDGQSRELDQSAAGYQTAGGFSKLGFNVSRVQYVAGGVSGYLALSGQATPDNLDSSEKFSLGGPTAVRAYPVGERASDDAWLATAELRWDPAAVADVQLVLFADAAGGRLNHDPLPTDENNDSGLAGGGAGLRWRKAADWSFETFAAWRADEAPTTEADRHPRVWGQLVRYF